MKLKELRVENNYTQTQLAEKIGCNQTAIGKYERGNLEPNIETLIKLSKIFNCSIDYIVENNENSILKIQQSSLTTKEQRLLKSFTQLDNDEQDKIIEDCEYFANKHIKSRRA